MDVILSLYVPGMFRGVWKNVLTLNVLYTDLSSLWMLGRTHYTHVCILCFSLWMPGQVGVWVCVCVGSFFFLYKEIRIHFDPEMNCFESQRFMGRPKYFLRGGSDFVDWLGSVRYDSDSHQSCNFDAWALHMICGLKFLSLVSRMLKVNYGACRRLHDVESLLYIQFFLLKFEISVPYFHINYLYTHFVSQNWNWMWGLFIKTFSTVQQDKVAHKHVRPGDLNMFNGSSI